MRQLLQNHALGAVCRWFDSNLFRRCEEVAQSVEQRKKFRNYTVSLNSCSFCFWDIGKMVHTPDCHSGEREFNSRISRTLKFQTNHLQNLTLRLRRKAVVKQAC